MTRVIGLDLSLASTGLVTAALDDDTGPAGPVRMFVRTVSTSPRSHIQQRHDDIVKAVLAMRDPRPGRTLCALEHRIRPKDERVMSAMDLAELHGVVKYGLWCLGIPYVLIYPTTLKVFATGNGNADKDAMLLAARGRLGKVTPVHNDDEADGLWLADMALTKYGRPLCNLPARNYRALLTPEWPEWNLTERNRS